MTLEKNESDVYVVIDGVRAIKITSDGVIEMRICGESNGYNEIAKLKQKMYCFDTDWVADRIAKKS